MAAEHRFRIAREAEIPEISSLARLFVHEVTGASALALANDDAEKCFGITFRTPSTDSTGVAHILEHSVLCGSRRFPSAPFAELLKGSLHTHLNASTQPDITTYMAASRNPRDFYNLFEVYLDAVFHPLLRETTFRQEGWHVIRDADGSPARLGGVVYNEMRGAYADPALLLARELRSALFPDTTYRHDEAGDPVSIPAATHEVLKRFHARHYHPSNALFFLWGDLGAGELLAFLDERLDGFERIPATRPSPLQPPFSSPRIIRKDYPDKRSDPSGGFASHGWVFPQPADRREMLGQLLLSEVLVGFAAAPLRQALSECGLGEKLIGEGFSGQTLQPVLSVGLSGIDPLHADRFDRLIGESVSALASGGFSREMIEAGLNRMEFRLRENGNVRYPQGLMVMQTTLDAWRRNNDPIDFLFFEQALADLRADAEADGGFLREMLRGCVVDNPHRATVILHPNPEVAERAGQAERRMLTALPSDNLSQPTESEVSSVASVPMLALEDLPRDALHIPSEIVRQDAPRVFVHPLATKGIAYLDLGFDLHALPHGLWPFVPLFGRALLENGTAHESADLTALRMARLTGGISAEHRIFARHGSQRAEAWLFLRIKATSEKFDGTLALLADILREPRIDDAGRIRALIQDELARHRNQLIRRGHEYADSALCTALHPVGLAAEETNGISQLRFLQRLLKRAESDWQSVYADLEQIRISLIGREGAVCGLAVEQAEQVRLVNSSLRFLTDLPAHTSPPSTDDTPRVSGSSGIIIDTPVSFVGHGANLPRTDACMGAYAAAVRHATGNWLWDRVRTQGGAYGVLGKLDPVSGNLRFLSYRDPDPANTLIAFEAVSSFLQRDISAEDIRRGIIGAVGEADRPRRSGEQGFEAMLSILAGDSDEKRQMRRDKLLGATKADFKELGEMIDAAEKHVAVLGPEQELRALNEERPGIFALQTLQ